MHIYASMKICKNASIQGCKYASMQVCTYVLNCPGWAFTSREKCRHWIFLFFLFFSWSWVLNGQISVQLDSNYLQKSNKCLQKSRKFRKCQKLGEKHQNGHISTIWPPNENLRALSFLQLSKLKKIKCPHFLDLWPLGWDIAIYSFSWFGSKLTILIKWQNGNISAHRPKIKKIKALSFLQL